MTGSIDVWGLRFVIMALAAALICAGLIVVLRPLLQRYALAKPNARSSHTQPTPQGGGIPVIASTILVIAAAVTVWPDLIGQLPQLAVVLAAAFGLAIVGVTDDVRPLEVWPRLILQAAAAACVVAVLPSELRVVPSLPWWIERAILLLAGLWFVNLVNFMDGIDWITVAEIVPLTAALAVFGLMDALPPAATIVALTLCGAMIGFAPSNRPVATLFLGDVGSLPIGLIVGWLLILLAGQGHLAAALLLPLYYLLDTGVTLVCRTLNGESITQAHRSHFYQRAVDAGMSVAQVVARVFTLNLALIALAAATIARPSPMLNAACLVTGLLLATLLMIRFARAGRARTQF
jgi:UDP-N-acetylmuramyl pentapeptide phosphotransferase/UDP-N-acetylglucosamine-1-phosphate transferase